MTSRSYRATALAASSPDPPASLGNQLHPFTFQCYRDWVRTSSVNEYEWSTWRAEWAVDVVVGPEVDVLRTLNELYDRALSEHMVPGMLPRLCDPPAVFTSEQAPVLRAELGALERMQSSSAVSTLIEIARSAERLGRGVSVVIEDATVG